MTIKVDVAIKFFAICGIAGALLGANAAVFIAILFF